MTGPQQGNPSLSDCDCVVLVSVLDKVRQSAKRGVLGPWGKTSQQIKVKFDLPYLNQHTHIAIVTPC